MFEVGFSELLLLGLVSLLVIGPKRLPTVARVAGFWLGRLQRTVANLKAEIHHELQLEDMRQMLEGRGGLAAPPTMADEVDEAAADLPPAGHDRRRPPPAKPAPPNHEAD